MDKVFTNETILPVILDGFSSNSLGSTDLRNCRLVCSEWKALATIILQRRNWSSRKFILFTTDEEIQSYLDTFANNKENVTFYCFHFRNLEGSTAEFSAEILDKFFQTFPNSIRSLILKIRFDSRKQLDSILHSQSDSLIELKVQQINDERTLSQPMKTEPDPGQKDFHLGSLKYLCADVSVYAAKFLQIICHTIPPENRCRNKFQICLLLHSTEIIKVIQVLKEYGLVKCLTSLQDEVITDGAAKTLNREGIELESLILDLQYYQCWGWSVGGEGPGQGQNQGIEMGLDSITYDMYEFICGQRNTLKNLFWGSQAFRFPPWEMPDLKKLRLERQFPNATANLPLGQDVDEVIEPVQLPFSYKEVFPKLEELVLGTSDDDRVSPLEFISMFLSPQEPCTQIQKLTVRYVKLNEQMLSTISTTFPKIKFLEIRMSRDELSDGADEQHFYSVLWNAEFASTIEELVTEISRSSVGVEFELDSLYSGVTIPKIRQIMAARSDDDQFENIKLKNQDSILNFKNLKRVEVRTSSFYSNFNDGFSDFSAHCVFGRMKSLRYLHLDDNLAQFSPSGFDALKQYKSSNLNETEAVPGQSQIEKAFQVDIDFYSKPKNERKYFNLLV